MLRRHVFYTPLESESEELGTDPLYGVITKVLDEETFSCEVCLGPNPTPIEMFVYREATLTSWGEPGSWTYDPAYSFEASLMIIAEL